MPTETLPQRGDFRWALAVHWATADTPVCYHGNGRQLASEFQPCTNDASDSLFRYIESKDATAHSQLFIQRFRVM